MPVLVSHTTIDCHDAYGLGQWWREVLSYEMQPEDPNGPGDQECLIHYPPSGHALLFIEVPGTHLPGKRVTSTCVPRRATSSACSGPRQRWRDRSRPSSEQYPARLLS